MGCIGWLMKNLIFLFNLIFVIIGLVLTVVGVLFKLDIDKVTEKLENSVFTTSANLLIAIGVLIFVIAFFGCCGAIKKNSCMLTTYGVILILLFILQIVAGVLAFMELKEGDNNLESELKTNLKKVFSETNAASKEYFNLIEKTVKCCGVDSYLDYPTNFRPIPSSCCKDRSICLPIPDYTEGCAKKLYAYIDDNISIVGYVAIGLCAVEVVGAIISFCLASSIKNDNRRGQYH